MDTHDERWCQADEAARKAADAAYEAADTRAGAKSDAYYHTYTREMAAFEHLEQMRKPLPNQAEVDAASVKALSVCPECHLPAPGGRCAHCDGEVYDYGTPGPSRPWKGD